MESQEHYSGKLTPGRAMRKARAVDAAPRFYSVSQVARMFGMSTMTVYRAIAAGEFPAIKVRGRLIVPASAIEAMADAAIADQTVVDAAGWVPEQVAR
ncbi:helix-turn-helix domain-containing protein [Pseudonocardia charpentierae]|uniref:Helix-turn-helix domain-containing protein n=1 Tax=Pseudonocardia charpentierae TaxID=3075545 RepID=A0ABU2NJY2_9PSEU|nr:helix-turn-helix domain-containing protein [Pseudonocardia sp. DSM 45834]MDT0352914.1 helix-turn-helix domain-containing protein [Pseudonocardia sp. DSM 45834]